MESHEHYSKRYKPISAWGYIGFSILFAIPVLGFILEIIFSLSDGNINRRSYARSKLLGLLLSILLVIALAATAIVMDRDHVITKAFGSLKTMVQEVESGLSGEIDDITRGGTVDIQVALDEYMVFFDEFDAFVSKLGEDPTNVELLTEYGSMCAKLTRAAAALENVDESKLDEVDAAYYHKTLDRMYVSLQSFQTEQ